jgi:hypothetical protein
LGNRALSGRKSLKICALWGKDNFWYISVKISMVRGERDFDLGICIILSMVSAVMVSRFSPYDEMIAP